MIARLTAVVFLVLFTAPKFLEAAKPRWKLQHGLSIPAEPRVVAFSPDGRLLAVGQADGGVSLWDTATGNRVSSFKAHTGAVRDARFVPGGDRFVTVGDGVARVWSTEDWTKLSEIAEVSVGCAVSPDGKTLGAFSSDYEIWIWDLDSGKRLKQLRDDKERGYLSVDFTSDGKYLLATQSLQAFAFDIADDEHVSFKKQGDVRSRFEISSAGGDESKMTISFGALEDDDAPIRGAATAPSKSLIALGRSWLGQPEFVDVWDLERVTRLARLKPKEGVNRISFSHDAVYVAIQGNRSHATVWSVKTQKRVAKLSGSDFVGFSPTSLQLVVADGSKLLVYAPK